MRASHGREAALVTTPGTGTRGDARNIDLAEVAKLVAAIEEDLARVQEGSRDVDALRTEVRALSRLLEAKAGEHEMGPGLQNVQRLLGGLEAVAVEDGFKAADYLARIGKMLAL